VVALGAARDGGAPVELAHAVSRAAAPVPVQLGGGVREVADAVSLAEAGIARVIVGTAAFGEIPLREFVAALDEQLVVSIDVAGGIVRTAGWLESSELTTREALERCIEAGVQRIVCTAIDRDGLPAGQTTPGSLVLRSNLGYTGTESRLQMLQNSNFVDAKVEIFGKHGSRTWQKLGEYMIDRQLLTQ